jgi:uncharacterized protein (TIGR00297 family)
MSPGRPLPAGEATRKFVHAGMAAFALALPWLTWWEAALCAGAAFAFNWLALPRVVGHRFRSDRNDVSDRGVLLYPLVVLALVVVFRERLALAALGWGVLAWGDSAAGVVGMKWGRRSLPWNPRKSWAGLLAYVIGGGLGGGILVGWYSFIRFRVGLPPGDRPALVNLAGGAALLLVPLALAALLETLPHGLDDNVLPPFVVATLVALATYGPEHGASASLLTALALNSACAVAALATRVLRPGGVAVAWALGVSVWMLGGWRAFVLLMAFLVLGLGVTFLGYGRKARAGVAEKHGGQRGFVEVFGKGGVLLMLAITAGVAQRWVGSHFAAWWAVVAILAAATADTWGTELGGLYGKRAFTLRPFAPARPGAPGAISWEGQLGSVAGATLIVGVAGPLGLLGLQPMLTGTICLVSAVAAALIESVLPTLGPADHTGKNLAMTFIAPLLAYLVLGASL